MDTQQTSRKKKRRRLSDSTNLEATTNVTDSEDANHLQLQELKEDVLAAIKASNDTILQLTKDSKIPLGLKHLLADAFKCHICRSCIQSPLVLAKCCKTVIGCESCVNSWYSGPDALSKTCPRCRAEKGFCETMRILGLDELVAGVKRILGGDDVAED